MTMEQSRHNTAENDGLTFTFPPTGGAVHCEGSGRIDGPVLWIHAHLGTDADVLKPLQRMDHEENTR